MRWTNEHVDYNLCQWVAECSNCHEQSQSVYTKVSSDFEFCPHCGAKRAEKENSYEVRNSHNPR